MKVNFGYNESNVTIIMKVITAFTITAILYVTALIFASVFKFSQVVYFITNRSLNDER